MSISITLMVEEEEKNSRYPIIMANLELTEENLKCAIL